jgi:hypothetical protein
VKLLSRLFCGEDPQNMADRNTKKAHPTKPGFWFLWLGVIIPTLAVVFESQLHFCARSFFDPLPSNLHVLLVLLIPLCNSLIWLSPRANFSAFYAPITLLSGMAMGIAVMYSIMFLPLASVSLMWIPVLGVGLLGLSPMLSMACLWKGESLIAHLVEQFGTFFEPHQIKHVGHLVVLTTVLVVEFPSTVTRIYMQMASKPETATQGIRMLRQYGSQEVMLRACYERSGRATDILGSICEIGHPLKVQQARDIFYKVTGKPFNSIAIPKTMRATIQHAGTGNEFGELNRGVEDEFDLDTDIAGEVVSGFARGLAVKVSTFSGTVDPDAALAEINWTFSFSNSSQYDREARAKVLLPAGAVVTKATVWVGGQEREAEIHVRSQARAEYRAAVNQKSGPLLVSVCGPDSVLVQCYPVMPSGELKVRLGIVAPLGLDSSKQGVLALPSFEERNFQIETEHRLSIISPKSLRVGTTVAGAGSSGSKLATMSVNLKNAELSASTALIHAERDSNSGAAWTADDFSAGQKYNVVERPIEAYPVAPKQLAILVDGSIGMAPYIEAVRDALRDLPPTVKVSLTLVSDVPQNICTAGSSSSDSNFQMLLGALKKTSCEGGQNNFPELLTQLSNVRAGSAADGRAILWIHASQPQSSPELLNLHNWLNAKDWRAPAIYDLQVISGPNEALDGVVNRAAVSRVMRVGTVSADLQRLFSGWSNQSKFASIELNREVAGEQAADGQHGPAALAQLWASREVDRKLSVGEESEQSEALALASTYHLVTPVSSAVALEPKEGWKAAARLAIAVKSPWRTGLKALFTKKLNASESIGSRRASLFDRPTVSQSAGEDNSSFGAKQQKAMRAPEVKQETSEAGQEAPMLQGATNGTIGPQSGDATVVAGINTAGTVSLDSANEQADTAPETSTVPESDTWLLIAAVMLMFGALLARNRLRVRKV